MGLTAPFMQIFFGHYEFYAPSFLMISACLMSFVFSLQTGKRGWLLVSSGLVLINIKLHVTSYLLFLPLGLTCAYVFFEKIRNQFNWRRITFWVLLPLQTIGAFIYFFITKSYDGPRIYTAETLERALFLPLFTNEGLQFERYNLFGLNHLVDYFNLIFLWSAVALFLLVSIVLCYRKAIHWNEPALIVISTTLILYSTSFFILNPQLSMPVDWDLFSLPAISLIVFVVLLLHNFK